MCSMSTELWVPYWLYSVYSVEPVHLSHFHCAQYYKYVYGACWGSQWSHLCAGPQSNQSISLSFKPTSKLPNGLNQLTFAYFHWLFHVSPDILNHTVPGLFSLCRLFPVIIVSCWSLTFSVYFLHTTWNKCGSQFLFFLYVLLNVHMTHHLDAILHVSLNYNNIIKVLTKSYQ